MEARPLVSIKVKGKAVEPMQMIVVHIDQFN